MNKFNESTSLKYKIMFLRSNYDKLYMRYKSILLLKGSLLLKKDCM